jgi:pilus assembly protein Flp/PilA
MTKLADVCHKKSGRTLGMKNLLQRLWKEEEGQDLVEYGLLIFLIALAAIASMKSLASSISTVFSSAATSLTSTT